MIIVKVNYSEEFESAFITRNSSVERGVTLTYVLTKDLINILMTFHSLFHSNVEEKGMIVSDVQRMKSNKTLQVQTKQEAHKAPCLKPEPIKDMQENIAPLARTRRSMEKKPCGDVGSKQDGGMRKALEMDFGFKLSTEDVMTNSNPEFGFTLSTEDVLQPRPRDPERGVLQSSYHEDG